MFYDGNRIAGTDLYIQKIIVQRTTKIVMDQNELLIKWADKELIKGESPVMTQKYDSRYV